MTAHELAQKLLSGPNNLVMFQDTNSGSGPYCVVSADQRVADKGEFPNYFNMPEGFGFILLHN